MGRSEDYVPPCHLIFLFFPLISIVILCSVPVIDLRRNCHFGLAMQVLVIDASPVSLTLFSVLSWSLSIWDRVPAGLARIEAIETCFP